MEQNGAISISFACAVVNVYGVEKDAMPNSVFLMNIIRGLWRVFEVMICFTAVVMTRIVGDLKSN